MASKARLAKIRIGRIVNMVSLPERTRTCARGTPDTSLLSQPILPVPRLGAVCELRDSGWYCEIQAVRDCAISAIRTTHLI